MFVREHDNPHAVETPWHRRYLGWGPQGAEGLATGGELADQLGEAPVMGGPSGLGAKECDGLPCSVVPVPVVIHGAGIEEHEPGEVRRALRLDEHFREYGLPEPVDGDNVQAPVLHERGNGFHGVQGLLHPGPKLLLLRGVIRLRGGGHHSREGLHGQV
jgi:hypothetical protein